MGDNIKMDVREVELGGGGLDWIDLVQDGGMCPAFVNAVINI
jgi:hypothetical protein